MSGRGSAGGGGGSVAVTERGPTQAGHWKQLRVHLEQHMGDGQHWMEGRAAGGKDEGGHAPVPIALDVAPRDLKEAGGAVIGDNLLGYAPRAADLVAFDTVQEVFERVQTEVGTRGARVEGGFVVFGWCWMQRRCGVVVVVAGEIGRVGAGTEDVCVWIHGSHLSVIGVVLLR